MKKFLLLIVAFGGFAASMNAQAEMDAYRMGRNDLKGTARSISMGGAFGALGGDVTGIAVNPAGIGIYKSSEITTTMNVTNNQSNTVLGSQEWKDNKVTFKFDNLSYVGVFPINSDEVPLINFGFSYNRLKNFDRNILMQGDNQTSMSHYMAYRAGDIRPENLLINGRDASVFGSGADWLAIFGYNSKLIAPNSNNSFYSSTLPSNETVGNRLRLREEGSISSYDFNVGTTISNILSLGLTLAVTDIDYYLNSIYDESFSAGNFSLENILRTRGSGVQFKLGAIVKPIHELRIGVAYHSPTWYEMTDEYSANIITQYNNTANPLFFDSRSHRLLPYDYEYRTPDRWVFSLAGVIGNAVIVSADYELTNYGNMKLNDVNGWPLEDGLVNEGISSMFKTSSTLRVGAEVRFTPRFSGRAGYSWVESPFEQEYVDGNREVFTAGSIAHFTVDGNTNYFTYGLGYKFTPSFYADVAFIFKNQKDDLYSFSKVINQDGTIAIDSTPARLTTNSYGGLLTLGFRF